MKREQQPTGDDGLTRRRFGVVALATASTGCLGNDDRTHPTARLERESTYIKDVGFEVIPNLPGLASLRLHVRLKSADSIGSVSGLVLISPAGSQRDATRVLSGESASNLEPQRWGDGTYSVVVVSGGEFSRRRHSGGDALETVPVVVSGAK